LFLDPTAAAYILSSHKINESIILQPYLIQIVGCL